MNWTEIKDIAITVTSAITAISLFIGISFQYKNYKILQSKENENELYKLKVEKFSLLTKECYLLLQEITVEINRLHQKYKDGTLTDKKVEDAATLLDLKIDAFQDSFYINSTFLPTEINDLFENLLDLLFEKLDTDNVDGDEFEEALKVIGKCEEQLDIIIDKMREDAHVDELNRKMNIRIKSKI